MNRVAQISISILLAAALALCCRPARAQDADATDSDPDISGNVLQAETAMTLAPMPGDEKFIPASATAQLKSFSGGTLTLRPDATIDGSAVCLKNICRWSDTDATLFAPVANLAITHFAPGRYVARIGIDQVRQTLHDAGINIALVSFVGSESCTLTRNDAETEERDSLQDWLKSKTQPPAAPSAMPAAAQDSPIHTLRSLLSGDICQRLGIDPNAIEMVFNSTDDQVLNLAEPYFQFQITPRRVGGLGDVSWDVDIASGSVRHKAHIDAIARAWENELVMVAPLDYRQVIREQDVAEKRILAQQLPDVPLLTKAEAVGQSAARPLKPGMVLTSDMVDPLMLAKPGQIITVNVIHGSIQITAVAKAIDSGTLGQTIRARSDTDPTEVFEVTLTGPQQGTVTDVPGNETSPFASAVTK